jgi:hypothetical protein
VDTLRQTSAELVAQTTGTDETSQAVHAAHQADPQALTQAQGLVQELTGEVSVSLPLNCGRRRG